jgi:Baseplate J-like protein
VQDIFSRILLNHERKLFNAQQLRYDFGKSQSNFKAVAVTGTRSGIQHTFEKDIDYIVNNGTLEWSSSGQRPDDNTEFDVVYRDDKGNGKITDVTPGSVLSILVGAISKEIEILYEEMTQVYNSGFIDLAYGASLDRVVAILGIKRNEPVPASGYVTFWRNSFPEEIPYRETLLFEKRDEPYKFKNAPVKKIESISGIARNREYIFKENTHYVLEGDSLKWLKENEIPDKGKEFTVHYVGYKKIIVPAGTTISTPSRYGGNIVSFETIEEGILRMNNEQKFTAKVKVKCLLPGSIGNVPPNSIIQMPKPPEGVEAVNNTMPTEGGLDEQSDQSLREKARLKIYTLGNATLKALMEALKEVHGVVPDPEPVIIDPYDAPGIVKVLIEGAFDDTEITVAIEKTRAAGIKVEFARPRKVSLDINLNLIAYKTLDEDVKSKYVKEIEFIINKYLSSLPIGTSIIVNQLKTEIMLYIRSENYVQDINKVMIRANRISEEKVQNGNIDKKRDELEKGIPENSPVAVIQETAKVDIGREEKAVLGSVNVAVQSEKIQEIT